MPQDAATRLADLKRQREAIEAEERAIAEGLRGREPAERPFPADGITRLRGADYRTWFKAMGSMGESARWDSYAAMQGLLDEEVMEVNAPAAFYSQQIMGRVLWPGIVPREDLISDLNARGGWSGDFRAIYPRWQYEYRVEETVGGVVIRRYVYRARQPRTRRDAARGVGAL